MFVLPLVAWLSLLVVAEPAGANFVQHPGFSSPLNEWKARAQFQHEAQNTPAVATNTDASSVLYSIIGVTSLVAFCVVAVMIYRRRASSRASKMVSPLVEAPIFCEGQASKLTENQPELQVSNPTSKLPPGWEEYFDQNRNQPYFFNRITRETVWEIPHNLK